MVVLSVLYFFVVTFCLGFTATAFVKNSDNFLERNLMRIGFGLALLPFLGLVLNLAKLPAHWLILLVLSLIYPVYYLFKNFKSFHPAFKLTKTNLNILLMLLIFLGSFYIYGTGAFKYPYLEDDDSWSHAVGVKYASIEKTAFTSNGKLFHYMDPYPPTYDLLLGILHQTNDSVYWTLKFFNALIISLGFVFFYFFAAEFMGSPRKALFATFVLASVPAFLSHFIWALALSVPLYFVTFYAVEKIKHDKKWWIVAALVMVTTLTSSPTHSAYFGIFFVLYFLAKMALERKFLLYPLLAGFSGVLLSFLVWWLPMILRYGVTGVLRGVGLASYGGVLNVGGTSNRTYTLGDFIWTKTTNMINNPIGIGIVVSLLVLIGVIALLIRYKRLLQPEHHWLAISLIWFLMALYAVNAANMPIKLSPFRAWMILAIPVSLLAAEGGAFLAGFLGTKGALRAGLFLLLLAGVFFTSTYQKYTVNTAVWPPGAFWTSFDEVNGYVWMKDNLPPNTAVFTFVNNGPVIGMDMYTCHWCDDVRSFQEGGFNASADETYGWLKQRSYSYLTIDGQTAKKFGAEAANTKVNELLSSNRFTVVHNNQGFLLLGLV